MSKLSIPDGEYNISISDKLLAHLANLNSNNVANLRNVKNDQLLSLKYGKYPDVIDSSKPFELEKEDKKNGSFKLRASTMEKEANILIEGHSAESKEIDCVLVYNESTRTFDLQRLGYLLRASPNFKSEQTIINATTQPAAERKLEAPKKKKRVKESSVFQPKQPRSKTPTTTSFSASHTNVNRASSAPVDDKSAGQNAINPPLLPSPLSSSSSKKTNISSALFGSPKRPKKNSTLSGLQNIQTSGQSDSSLNETFASSMDTKKNISRPSTTQLNLPVASTVASTGTAGSLSKLVTPTIVETPHYVQDDEEDDDDEFGDLADELEKALSGDESFGIITVDDRDTDHSENSRVTTKLGLMDSKKNGPPINLRNLTSIGTLNEDDLSSSEEE